MMEMIKTNHCYYSKIDDGYYCNTMFQEGGCLYHEPIFKDHELNNCKFYDVVCTCEKAQLHARMSEVL